MDPVILILVTIAIGIVIALALLGRQAKSNYFNSLF
jgi:hypothetical protein